MASILERDAARAQAKNEIEAFIRTLPSAQAAAAARPVDFADTDHLTDDLHLSEADLDTLFRWLVRTYNKRDISRNRLPNFTFEDLCKRCSLELFDGEFSLH